MGKKTQLARLRDPGTIYSDPDSDFALSGKEVRPLPKRLGQTLTARIRTGAIILVDDPPGKTQPKPKALSQMNKVELLAEVGRRAGLAGKLAELATAQGKAKPDDVANREIVALISDFDSAGLKQQRMGDPALWSREDLLAELEELEGGKEKLAALIQEYGDNVTDRELAELVLALHRELAGGDN